jgi:hypothetical protein
MIARGVLSAMESLEIAIPVIVRIQGTNGKLGMQMVRPHLNLTHSEIANSGFKNIHAEENLYDAVQRTVKLAKRLEQERRNNKEGSMKRSMSKNERSSHLKGSPFPDVYTLIHTSSAFRTRRGRIRPAVLTFAIEGQGNRRVRLTRPWKIGDPPLNIRRLSISEAKRLNGGMKGFAKRKEKAERFQQYMRDMEKGLIGPTEAFFKE